MRAIMYHYIRDFNPCLPHFRFLEFNNFKKQLDYFAQEFGFVEQDEFKNFIKTGEMPAQEGKIILTFDDGLRDHYAVFQELRRRKLWGIFYIPTRPYAHREMLEVHKIHLLCGQIDGKNLLTKTLELISEDMIPDSKKEEFHSHTYNNQINLKGVSETKRILNYFIDYKYRKTLTDQLCKKFNVNTDHEGYYLNPDQMREMNDGGMMLGSHTVHHPVMSKLDYEAQEYEIKHSFKTLSSMFDLNMQTFCYPYGGFHSFNEDTVKILEENKIDFSFNVENRQVEYKDFRTKQYLPRFDCNIFKYGKAS